MFSFYLFHKFNILIFAAHYGIEPLFRRYVSHLPKAPQDLFFLAPWYGQIILTVFMAYKLTNLLVLGTGLEPAFTDLKGRLPKTN